MAHAMRPAASDLAKERLGTLDAWRSTQLDSHLIDRHVSSSVFGGEVFFSLLRFTRFSYLSARAAEAVSAASQTLFLLSNGRSIGQKLLGLELLSRGCQAVSQPQLAVYGLLRFILPVVEEKIPSVVVLWSRILDLVSCFLFLKTGSAFGLPELVSGVHVNRHLIGNYDLAMDVTQRSMLLAGLEKLFGNLRPLLKYRPKRKIASPSGCISCGESGCVAVSLQPCLHRFCYVCLGPSQKTCSFCSTKIARIRRIS